jgi:hypothetical protein
MATRRITVAETLPFLRQVTGVWSDAAGGVRKVRWSRAGMGKRGGTRVIYFYHDDSMPLYLLLIYAKAQREDLSPDQKKRVQALVANLKQANRRH